MSDVAVIRTVHAIKLDVPHSVRNAGQADQYVATAALLKLVADAYNDIQAYIASPNKSALGALLMLGNLAPDAATVVTQIMNLPGDLESMTSDGLEALLAQFSSNLQVPSEHAQNIVNAVLKLVQDAYAGTKDVIGLIQAAKS